MLGAISTPIDYHTRLHASKTYPRDALWYTAILFSQRTLLEKASRRLPPSLCCWLPSFRRLLMFFLAGYSRVGYFPLFSVLRSFHDYALLVPRYLLPHP